ncbi:MAG: VCBS repeat-containing protein [Leptospiraceae bacterium]
MNRTNRFQKTTALLLLGILTQSSQISCLKPVCDERDPNCNVWAWLYVIPPRCFDAAVANTTGVADYIYLNDGQGNFATRVLFSGDGFNGTGIASEDIDGNGFADLFVANGTAGINRYYLNKSNASGFFDGFNAASDTDNSTAATLADFNGDGWVDALVVNSGGVPPRLYLNDGFGGYPAGFNAGTDTLPATGVDSGDLDGDGDIDAFVTNTTGNVNRVYLNDGLGNFSLSDASSPDTNNSRDIVLGDLDGDGDLDAFVVNDAGPTSKIYVNAGNGTFSVQNAGPDVSTHLGLDLGDLDGDGDLDAFAVSNAGPVLIFRNEGGLIFTEINPTTDADTGSDIALGDLDGDGDLDAFAANDAGGQANRVYINDGSGQFLSRVASVDANPSSDVVLTEFHGPGCQNIQ